MAIRRRIGLIVPSTNSTAEPDFSMVAPPGVTIHSHRMWNTNELTPETVERMNTDIEQAARYLATAKVELVAYACTTGSFFKGSGYDQEMIRSMEKAAGVPAVATAPAAVEALRFFGAKRISVATPYTRWQNERLRIYYEAQGFEVLNVEGDPQGAVAGGQGHCDLSPKSVVEFATRVFDPRADVLFCSCTAWRSMEVAAELEQRIGKPVVTANQSTAWAAFRRLGINNPRPGYGSLMDSIAKARV